MTKHALVQHLQAVKTLLAAVIGTVSYQKTLESQCSALSNAIAMETFTVLEAAAIVEELRALPQQQQTELTGKLMDRVGSLAKPASARLALQDYSNFCHYLTQTQWETLQGDELPHGKLELLLLAAVRVGLRNPSETTTQHLCSMHLILSEGKSKSMQLTPSVKLECARNLKAKFKSILSRMSVGLPTEYIPRLPVSVIEFAQAHAAWHAFAFKDEPPVPTRLQVAELQEVMCSVPMRSSRTDARGMNFQMRGQHQQQQQQQQLQLPGMQPDMTAMMQMFLNMATQRSSSPQVDIQYVDRSLQPERRALQRLQSRLALADSQPEGGSEPSVSRAVEQQMPEMIEVQQQIDVKSESKKRSLSAMDAAAAVAAALTSRKEEKQEEKAKQPDQSDAKGTEAKSKPGAPKAKAKSKAAAKAKSSSSKNKQTKDSPSKTKVKSSTKTDKAKATPTWHYERSRNQILCRTGLTGPGQTKTISGVGPASVRAAEKWVREYKP